MNDFTSNDISELATALCTFQGNMHVIEKDKAVNIRTKSGYNIKYNYTDLATIMKQIRPLLLKCGLSVSHAICTNEANHRFLVTTLMHSSGQWMRSNMIIEQCSDEKSLGAKITYYRRYALSALLGLVTDDDVDADMQGGTHLELENQDNFSGNANQEKEPVKLTKEAMRFSLHYKGNETFFDFIDFLAEKSGKSNAEVMNEAAKNENGFNLAFCNFQEKKGLPQETKSPEAQKENQKRKK